MRVPKELIAKMDRLIADGYGRLSTAQINVEIAEAMLEFYAEHPYHAVELQADRDFQALIQRYQLR